MQTREHARWPWLLGAVVLIGAGVWLFRPQGAQAPATVAAKGEAAPTLTNTPPAPAPAAAPAIAHPIAPDAAADAAIPALGSSDGAVLSALAGVVGDDGALAILLRDHLVQRLVVMVDNLPQRSIAPRALAYRPLQDTLATATGDDQVQVLDTAANARRYAPFVRAFVQADASALAGAYRRFYPLFQQAYVEVGPPQGYFNDRLVTVIDHLLQTPVPRQPLAVVPGANGKLRFADPSLESLSVGQKAVLRLAPEQAEAVKQQLRAFRAAITGA
ncbi:hypothetical protein ARC20_05940 [Stenotrophomonas panacihumi]|uniref:DUF3014 domain-containing protein n=1 Tax=Stenotrophomonas panacihumi TaxID=676599 RepID=A0A0R0ALV8_9GAMM|nr:DUF3014 domain-containing protein [Stenotrophomonas panacihumi]KRG46262.1 hypothetical protein ARC20_05940 [Stenotrophomonas panacihumi]PTN54833.1 DUF3014 domain-containing protein [Stenotrophomonas panacihumi]